MRPPAHHDVHVCSVTKHFSRDHGVRNTSQTMVGGPLRLRHDRAVHAGRRSRRWRLPLTGGVFALIVGATFWAPLAPTALAPTAPAEPGVPAPVARVAPVAAGAPVVALPAIIAPRLAPVAPTATPVPVP